MKEKQKEQQRDSSHGLPTIVVTEPGQSHEPVTESKSPMWVAPIQPLKRSPDTFQD